MSNLRIIVVFVVAVLIVLSALFQMQLRGYQEVAQINVYILYESEPETCQDQLITIDSTEYRIICENKYLLKSGLSEYTMIEALQQEIVELEEIEPYLTIE